MDNDNYIEYIRVCADCRFAVDEVHAGDEGWTVCSGCRNIEGPTIEITMEEYENS